MLGLKDGALSGSHSKKTMLTMSLPMCRFLSTCNNKPNQGQGQMKVKANFHKQMQTFSKFKKKNAMLPTSLKMFRSVSNYNNKRIQSQIK
jgi:hypothetical protein